MRIRTLATCWVVWIQLFEIYLRILDSDCWYLSKRLNPLHHIVVSVLNVRVPKMSQIVFCLFVKLEYVLVTVFF